MHSWLFPLRGDGAARVKSMDEGTNMGKSKRFLLILAAAFWALAAIVFFSAGEQFRRISVINDALALSDSAFGREAHAF